ncbi:MAG: HU family DNA-binding protein [Thermodesulfobacteriota bacterium]|nr:HU family DNA-binding protein [Thermodesulfobacteriota bacterium]
MPQTKQPPPCPGCNGTGQMTWFGGVSRFQFSYEDCPECNGVGFLIPAEKNIISAEKIACSALSPTQAEQFLKALTQILSTTLSKDETIQLRGFGSFSRVSTKSSLTKIRFTPGKKLLLKMNKPE